MIQDRIAQIEATLRSATSIPEATRFELLELLATLKAEVGPLVATHGDSAQHITGRADAAVQAAVNRDGQTAEALEGLASSVRDFEVSHPRLVQVVDRLALTLSNMGI
jgi:hypothetical protein